MEKSLEPVDVYLSTGHGRTQGVGFIWSPRDAFRVRNEMRLLGDFVGTLPKHSAQNQYLSLPLVLGYEELMFGMDRGLFRVLSDSSTTDYVRRTSESATVAAHAFYSARDSECNRQAAIATEQREIERRKRLAKEQRRRQRASGAQSTAMQDAAKSRKRRRNENAADQGEDVVERPAKVQHTESRNTIFGFVSSAFRSILSSLFSYRVPTLTSPPDANAAPEADDDDKAASRREAQLRQKAYTQARASAIVITPTEARPGERTRATTVERINPPQGVSPRRLRHRAIVFRDLYARGYYMSCGAKFGADFLAYAGEPLLFHAALAVIVMGPNDAISPHDVVALGRLGDSTKKRTVLAHIDEERGNAVRYIGVQWEESLP